MRTLAPAKINWTLEVLGKRADGYHEIKSVMQTIDLCDEVEVLSAPDLLEASKMPTDPRPGSVTLPVLPHKFYYAAEHGVGGEGLLGESVVRVIGLLDQQGANAARVSLDKKIPVAAGLGGGSSDAAAALRCLNELWELGLQGEQLRQIGLQIGSDVPFFLYGGTALAEGRGEMIASLPDASPRWLVVLVPAIQLRDKTKRMYEALMPGDFGDGTKTTALTVRIRHGDPVRPDDIYNVFERAAYESFAGLAAYRQALLIAGAGSVHLAGAGPALFAVLDSREEADALASDLRDSDAHAFVARTLSGEEATAVVVSE